MPEFKMEALIFAFILFSASVKSDLVRYYENLIEKELSKARNYVHPEDASEFKPATSEIFNGGTFDFIIVGGGSSGSVIASRLSEIEFEQVLLLEAGSFPNDLTEIPAMTTITHQSPFNWAYKTVPQQQACLGYPNSSCSYPSGKSLGGSSTINGQIYARGNKFDFDNWGHPDWSYKNLLPYFKKSEAFKHSILFDSEYHGRSGNLKVQYQNFQTLSGALLMEANMDLGYYPTDINGRNQLGTSLVQITSHKGKRLDAGTAFLLPVLQRTNLKVRTESFVIKILIDKNKKTAYGVLYTYRGKLFKAMAKREVILSAGTFSSPKLLMLSGVGPYKHLKETGINVIQNLPVGNNLRDHVCLAVPIKSNISVPHQNLTSYIKQYLKGQGPLTSAGPVEVIAFYKTEEELDYPDLEISLSPQNEAKYLPKAVEQDNSNFMLVAIALHTKSIGSVKLKSNSPYDHPLIDPQLLSDEFNEDLSTLIQGLDLIESIINRDSFKTVNASLAIFDSLVPGCSNKSRKEYLECYIRYYAFAGYHQVGTCPMGSDPERSVVDFKNRVYGIKKLRVADASIIPRPISGHTNAACIMIGERVSDFIKQDHSLIE